MKKINDDNKRVLGVVTRVVSACFIFFTLLLPLNAAANLPGHLGQPSFTLYNTNNNNCRVADVYHIRTAFGSVINHINLLINHVAELGSHTAMLESRIGVNKDDSEREAVEDNGGCQDLSAAEERDELKERVSELEERIKKLEHMFGCNN